MKILFVCTGNICRSPMGELLFPLFFPGVDIVTDSAGVQGLDSSPIDPSSAKLMEADGIDSSRFRSKRLTPQLAMESDIIFCFTQHQRKHIAHLAPMAARKTFLLNDFANMCRYCAENGLVEGNNYQERLESVMSNASLIRPNIPPSQDIADPYRKEFAAFEQAHEEIGESIAEIASVAMPKRGSHAR